MSTGPPTTVAGVWQSNFGPVTLRCVPIPGSQYLSISGSWAQAPDRIGIIESGNYEPAAGSLGFQYFLPWKSIHGEARFHFEADTFVGTYTQADVPPGSWNLWGHSQDPEIVRFYDQAEQRLLSNTIKRYTKLNPPAPLDRAVTKRGVGPHVGVGQHVLAFTDGRNTPDRPSAIFARCKSWYATAIGEGQGAGVLIFVYATPTDEIVAEILKGFSLDNSIDIYGCVYNIANGQHLIRSYLDVEHDIFG